MGKFIETIDHWVSEFVTSTQGEMQCRGFGDRAGVVLVSFLDNACGSAVPPDELAEGNIVDGVAIGLGRLQLTDAEREKAPELLEVFLGYLESSGRLGGGEELGRHARHTVTAHLLKKQQRRSTIKVGPNDPCPCGSGKKYKKCCMHS